jgi:hypothetical protein
MDEPCAPEIVRDAISGLLAVVGKSADDLNAFRDAVSKAHIGTLPPFPRASLLITERIVDDLKRVERDLRDVLVALGLVP